MIAGEPYRFDVGAFDCIIASDGSYAYQHPADVFFIDAPSEDLTEALAEKDRHPDEWEEYISPYSSLVINTDEHTVLVDTGGGEMAPTTGDLQSSLATTGIEADSIDVVIITHGHADHIGGNLTEDGTPAFPNARYIMSRKEWEFWTREPDLSPLRVDDELKELLITAAQANLRPLDQRIELIDDAMEVVPGITVLPAPGHTPGHVVVEVTSNDETLLHVVDTVLLPLHIEHPEWTAAVDYAPEQTVATRQQLFERATNDDALVFASHFPLPGIGRIAATDTAWKWHPVGSSR